MDCRLQNNKPRFHPASFSYFLCFTTWAEEKKERGVRALRFAFFIEFLHEADPEE
jgi:hypothetical protein